MRFLVLGGGAQGSAAAFDLLQQQDVDEVVLGDIDPESVHPALLPYLGTRLRMERVDASSPLELRRAMEGVRGVLCALPYFLNLPVSRCAIEAGAHYADLGGNTSIVEQQRTLHEDARLQGVSVIPDSGLAPGMVNILAQAAVDEIECVESIRMWVGGLPQHPEPPLNYHVVYSLEGLLDYYVTPAVVLRDGRQASVEPLNGLERLRFPDPVGELEGFYTAGGVSTLPARYEGRIDTVEYKTLRYPGHADIMRAIRDLGLLSDEPVEIGGSTVNPREFFIHQVTPHLTRGDGRDLVVARVEVKGSQQAAGPGVRYDVLDYYDEKTGLTAMMRTTGFSLSITALLQARGEVAAAGVATPDEAVPPLRYIEELACRGIEVVRSEL